MNLNTQALHGLDKEIYQLVVSFSPLYKRLEEKGNK